MTTARTRIKLTHELRVQTLRVSKEPEDYLLRSLQRQQSAREHMWMLIVISSCEHDGSRCSSTSSSTSTRSSTRKLRLVTNLHEMHQVFINRAVDGEESCGQVCRAVCTVDETVQRSKPIIEETKIPQTQRRAGARTARRDERKSRDGAHEANRERIARSA